MSDNIIHLAYNFEDKKYYITTSFKNIAETDDWLKAIEIFAGEQSKLERDCDIDTIELPNVVMSSKGMFFKQNDNTYVNYEDLILEKDNNNNLTKVNFEKRYKYEEIKECLK